MLNFERRFNFKEVWLKSLFGLLDLILLTLSPFAILMFLVGAIGFTEAYGTHRAFVRSMTERGLIAEAQISMYQAGDQYIAVEFRDENGETRYGTIDTRYYNLEKLENLDSTLSIRYLPERYESSYIIEDYFFDFRDYNDNLVTPFLLMAISWLVIVLKPQFLYIGYDSAMQLAFKRL